MVVRMQVVARYVHEVHRHSLGLLCMYMQHGNGVTADAMALHNCWWWFRVAGKSVGRHWWSFVHRQGITGLAERRTRNCDGRKVWIRASSACPLYASRTFLWTYILHRTTTNYGIVFWPPPLMPIQQLVENCVSYCRIFNLCGEMSIGGNEFLSAKTILLMRPLSVFGIFDCKV